MPTRAELVTALWRAHSNHRKFQGGNFFDCFTCRLHVMFRDEALTYVPKRARKERAITTLDEVLATVR